MARRPQQTLADYLVIAISPALIMALVGSLMFFLLRLFYQGQFQERMHWVMACFVFASVLIGRISIEEGFERAAPFGAALGLLVGIAANRFMEYQGTWLDDYGWIVNFSVIGLVWWCAHQLTWDCTVIDEAEDSSGEGLMQIVGLEQPADARNATSDPLRGEGTTARDVPAGYWQRYLQRQKRPHAPGVWVVYFSLAALPIFGLGQGLIPASDTAGRRYVFWLLLIYVAAGLGLLLTTSFLGLRRYLRQRRVEMPVLMTNLWLTTGVAIIGALLIVAALLPRPSPEIALSRLPFQLRSEDQEASDHAVHSADGTHDPSGGSAADRESQSESGDRETGDKSEPQPPTTGQGNVSQRSESQGDSPEQDRSGESAEQAEPQPRDSNPGQQPGAQESQQSNDSGESRSEQRSSPKSSQSADDAQSQRSEADRSGEVQSRDQDAEHSKENDAQEPQADQAAEMSAQKPPSAASESSEEEKTEESSSAAAPEAERSPTDLLPESPGLGPLAVILKYAFYALFAGGVLAALWFYRREVWQAVVSFLDELRAWWRGLWSGSTREPLPEGLTAEIRAPVMPFASYMNPFASGEAERLTPAELVRYSFEAFEAWGREHGCERAAVETPHELARAVGQVNAFIAADARNLAELYARAAFSRSELPSSTREHLRGLWGKMARGTGRGA